VADVVTSLDHSLAPTDCVEEPDECRLSGACSQREMWQDVEKMLVDHLTNVQVSDLAKKQSSLVTALNPLVTAAPVAN
jgi:DNA-binding IscR family transcriptional regulator